MWSTSESRVTCRGDKERSCESRLIRPLAGSFSLFDEGSMGVMSSKNVSLCPVRPICSCNIAFARLIVFLLGSLRRRHLLCLPFVASVNVQRDAEALCGRRWGVLERLHLDEASMVARKGISSI
jgi:hypothetical protein